MEEIVRRRQMILTSFMVIDEQRRNKRLQNTRRRLWSRSWLLRRDQQHNVFSMLFKELGPEDPAAFANFTRMQEDVWNDLLSIIEPHIQRKNTNMREAISARDRLILTLRFLATGNTFQDLSFTARVAANTISGIVHTTVQAIIKVLEAKVISFPATDEEWKLIAHKFEVLWNFPHCVGALDGKHISFRCPRKEGSKYRNYKGTDSIILLALVDAEYKFLFVDVGRNGRMHDSAVLRESPLGNKINDGSLNLPAPCEISEDLILPYVMVADDAFSLKINLLKPYPDRGLTIEKKIFNYRLSRARRTVENAFGILANRWRVLLNAIPLSIEKVESITYACVLLHNFLMGKSSSKKWYIPEAITNLTENLPDKQVRGRSNRSTNDALKVRDHFCHYFNTVGAVPFQYAAVEMGNR